MPSERRAIRRFLCAAVAVAAAALTVARGAADSPSLADVRSFACQIERCESGALSASPYDMLVVDVANDFRDWTPEEVASMRNGPCGPRLVLATLSIGEAEDFRWYWRDLPPELLGNQVRARDENYKVRFWDQRWRDVIFGTRSGLAESSLDRILDQGFDGVVLDNIEGFEAFIPHAVGAAAERPTAAMDMVQFVEDIARYARVERGLPGFVVLAEDGTSIVVRKSHIAAGDAKAEAALAEQRWLGVIDGVVATDSFFHGRRRIDNAYQPRLYVLERLDRFHAAGKPIFAVDYVAQRRKVQTFHERCAAHGFLGFATNRALSRIATSRFAPAVPGCR